jgi:hypothetical protein
MSGGAMKVGSAEVELTLTQDQYNRALLAAQQQTLTAVSQMAASFDQIHPKAASAGEDVRASFLNPIKRLEQEVADSAGKIAGALEQMGAKGASSGVLKFADGLNLVASKVIPIAAGLALARFAFQQFADVVNAVVTPLKEASDAAREHERNIRAVTGVYGDSVSVITEWSNAMESSTHIDDDKWLEAAKHMGFLTREYGMSTQQITELSERASDLASLYGGGLQTAVTGLTSVMMGRARAGYALGLIVNDEIVKERQATEIQKKYWDELDNATKAQLRFAEVMAQSNTAVGQTAKIAESLTGAENRLATAQDRVNTAIGNMANQVLKPAINLMGELSEHAASTAEAMEYLWNTTAKGLEVLQAIRAGITEFKNPVDGIRAIAEADRLAAEERARNPAGAAEIAKAQVEAERKAAEDKRLLAREAADEAKAYGDQQMELNREITEDALRGIEFQRRAGSEWYEEQLRDLERTRDAKLKAIEITHKADMEALAVERKEKVDAADAAIKAAERERDVKLDGARAVREATVETLKGNAAGLMDEYDRQLRDLERERDSLTKAANDDHNQVLKNIREERDEKQRTWLMEDRRLQDLRRAEDRTVSDQQRGGQAALRSDHEWALRAIEAEQNGRQRAHDSMLKGFDEEQQAAQRNHNTRLREIADELEAAQAAHDGALKDLNGQLSGADSTHNARLRELDTEKGAENDRHAAVVKNLDTEKKVAGDAHKAKLANLKAERDAEQARLKSVLDGLDKARSAEDKRHQAAMVALDKEAEARMAPIRAQLEALDQLGQAETRGRQDTKQQEAVAAAQQDLSSAIATGDPTQIIAARQRLADAEQAIRDTARERELADQKASLNDQLDAVKTEIEERKKLENEANKSRIEQIQAQADAEKQQTENRLSQIDQMAQAEDDAFDQHMRLIDQQKDAEDELHDQRITNIQDHLDAENQRYQALKANIQAQIEAENERFNQVKDHLSEEKEQSEDTLQKAKDSIDRRRLLEQNAFEHVMGELQQRVDEENAAYALAEAQAQAKFEADNRRREDTRLAEDRALQDARAAENVAFTDRENQANTARDNELERIRLTFDDKDVGLIPWTLKAKSETKDRFDKQIEQANAAYEAEVKKIKWAYDGADGNTDAVIPKLRKAKEDIVAWFADRQQAMAAAYTAEKENIVDTYNDKDKGLIPLMQKAKTTFEEWMTSQKEDWQTWETDTTKHIGEVIKKAEDLAKALSKIGMARPGAGSGGGGGGDPGGGAAFPSAPFDGTHHPIVRGADADSYWTSGGTHGGHPAADIFATKGTTIYAPVSGLSVPGTYPLGGNTSILRGDDGKFYYMAHGNVPFKGGRVKGGEAIGQVGDTGNARGTKPHVHFAIASSEGLFSSWNGSGDINGGPEWWTATGTADGPSGGDAGSWINDYLNGGFPGGGGVDPMNPNASPEEIRAFVSAQSQLRGIDPMTALTVVSGEGGLEPARRGTFSTGSSWWPFQLHYGGSGYEYLGNQAGMGNDFTAKTGWQPGDPRAWGASTIYALDVAKRQGWGPPGGWYGAHKAGITGFSGIRRDPGGNAAFSGSIPPPPMLMPMAGVGSDAVAMASYGADWSRPIAPATAGSGSGSTGGSRQITYVLSGIGLDEVAGEIARRERRRELLEV